MTLSAALNVDTAVAQSTTSGAQRETLSIALQLACNHGPDRGSSFVYTIGPTNQQLRPSGYLPGLRPGLTRWNPSCVSYLLFSLTCPSPGDRASQLLLSLTNTGLHREANPDSYPPNPLGPARHRTQSHTFRRMLLSTAFAHFDCIEGCPTTQPGFQPATLADEAHRPSLLPRS